MELGLKDKSVVVTGASQGIGYAIAEAFLQEGAYVYITGRNKQTLQETVDKLGDIYGRDRIEGYSLDGSREEDTLKLGEYAAKRTGRIDVWVNNIGTNRPRKGEIYTEEELDYLIGILFKSAVFGSQTAYLHMKEQGGAIVNIASLAARSATCGRSTIYGALKSAMIGLTNTTAGEYAAYGIRVNAVMPGYTKTPLIASNFTQEAIDALMVNNLVGRMAEPEEIAKPVLFLASEAASYITGASLEVSGGHDRVLNPQYSFDKKKEEEKI